MGDEQCRGYNGTRGGEVVPDNLKKKNCILQYDLDGSFIQCFNSLSSAARSVGVSRNALTNVIYGDGITCGGYQWRHIDDSRVVHAVRNGMDNVRKAVIKYNMNGEYIDTYESLEDAAKSVGTYSSSISKVCRGIHKSHKGYIWRYEDDTLTDDELNDMSNKCNKRAVIQISEDMNVINKFESATDASRKTGIAIGSIRRACTDLKFKAGGYRWAFLDDSKLQHKHAVVQMSIDGTMVVEYASMMEASKVSGVDRSSIYNCCIGRTKTAGGYIWRYK